MMINKINCYPMADLVPIICSFLEQDKDVTLTARGNSMRPILVDRRDLLTLSSCDPHSLSVGEVVLYKRDNGVYVVHRIIGKEQGNYTMMGDGQANREPGIRPDQILAKMTSFVRNGKLISCSDKGYLRYTRFWTNSYFWRRVHIRLNLLRLKFQKN